MGIQPVTLSRWETGDRALSLSMLASAARTLGVQLPVLLDVTVELPEPTEEPDVAEATRLVRSMPKERRELALRLLRDLAR